MESTLASKEAGSVGGGLAGEAPGGTGVGLGETGGKLSGKGTSGGPEGEPAGGKPEGKPRSKANRGEIVATILKCVLLGVWTGLAVEVVMWLVGEALLLLLGAETLAKPLWTGVYSAITYVIAFLVLWLLTPKLMDFWGRLKGWVRQKCLKQARSELRKTGVKHKIASREELGLRGLPTWTDVGLGPVGLIVTLVASEGLVLLFSFFPWFNAAEEQPLEFSPTIEGGDRVIAFLIIAVVAPIVEELIFRGWLYGKLREITGAKMAKWQSVVTSIVIVSLLFALLHGQWNVGILTFVMSVIMCLFREMTGTIYAGILVHVLKNALAFYVLYVLQA